VFTGIVTSLLVAVDAWAQTKTGTTVGQFLLIEPSARYAGMGNAAVASSEEIAATYYNPGALGRLHGYGVQVTHSEWLADIAYDYVAALVGMGNIGNLLFTATSLQSGEIDVRTVDQPLGTGERYTVSDIALGVGYGRQVTDRFSMGVQVSYMQETIWHSSLATVAINVGTLYNLTPGGLRLGASIANFGLAARYQGRDLRIQYDNDPRRYGDNSSLPGEIYTEKFPLPVLFRVGLSLPMRINSQHQIWAAVTAFHPSDNTESISLGVEWQMFGAVALRAGYQNLFLQDSEVGLTLGAGARLALGDTELHVDYAWADHGRLAYTQRFSLGFMF